MYGDQFQSEWEPNEHCEVETDASRRNSGSQTASDIRNALAQYLSKYYYITLLLYCYCFMKLLLCTGC